MQFSLVAVMAENSNGIITGVWLQNHVGTLESAARRARATELANGNRIQIAVVEDLNYSSPNYSDRTGLKRLD